MGLSLRLGPGLSSPSMGGGAAAGTFIMRVPDLPTSNPGKGFVMTGFDIRAANGHYYAADGVGRLSQDDTGPLASALVQMTRSGDTLSLVDYWMLADLMAGLEESAGVPVDPTVYSFQGVSCYDANDTIHMTCVNASVANLCWRLILDPNNDMARLDADRLASSAVQHFEPDPVTGNYQALSAATVRRRALATLSNSGLGTAFALSGITTADMCDARTAGRLHITSGGNGPDGTITTLAPAADMSTATLLGTYTLTGITAVEGIRSRPTELLIGVDPAYHLTGGPGAVNAIIAIRPNPLIALYP